MREYLNEWFPSSCVALALGRCAWLDVPFGPLGGRRCTEKIGYVLATLAMTGRAKSPELEVRGGVVSPMCCPHPTRPVLLSSPFAVRFYGQAGNASGLLHAP